MNKKKKKTALCWKDRGGDQNQMRGGAGRTHFRGLNTRVVWTMRSRKRKRFLPWAAKKRKGGRSFRDDDQSTQFQSSGIAQNNIGIM